MFSAALSPPSPHLPGIRHTKLRNNDNTRRKTLRCGAGGRRRPEIASWAGDYDLYSLLGVESSSEGEEIRKAYRALQKRIHPDIAGPDGHDMAILLNQVYSLLSDPDSRAAYDRERTILSEFNGYTGEPMYSRWLGPKSEQRAVFVDEVKCIGCLKCALHAPNTFAIELGYGRARVVSQWADPEDRILDAIDTCPVDCISIVERSDLPALEFLMSKQPRVSVRLTGGNNAGVRVADVFEEVKKFKRKFDEMYAKNVSETAQLLMKGGSENYTSTLKQYQAKAEFFLCASLQKNHGYNVPLTPGGLLYFDGWNNMQYVSANAFLMAVYADYLSLTNSNLNCPDGQVPPHDILMFSKSQADYILGKNPKQMSYLVGFEDHYPIYVHHRGASIASKSILPVAVGCLQGFEQWYDSKKGNPNVIAGALVGGPDHQDFFVDRRSNYEQTEPAIAGNAPLVGLFAKMDTISKGPGYPTAEKEKPTTASTQEGYGPQETKPSPPKEAASAYPATGNAVEFFHSITKTWSHKGADYYRHKVTITNKRGKPITNLNLAVENLSGPIWGLSPATAKNSYEFPPWRKVLSPGEQFSFVYIQGGSQAKVSVISYE